MALEYMDNTKNDYYYLNKIKTDIAFIVAHMQDVDVQELNSDEILLDSMLFRMIQISENGSVDLNIVFETLKYDIPELLERLNNNEGQ